MEQLRVWKNGTVKSVEGQKTVKNGTVKNGTVMNGFNDERMDA